ncbi:MAG TPA: hypothetical protein VGS17_10965 [Candidatus Limnocylindria bacterium]|nr:hypothetical protein [Candidatus Limnocylindria bacterium]
MNDWLDGVFGTVRCANCGAVYGRDSIAVVGNRDEYWFVRCTCETCGTQGLGVVIVKRVSEALPASAQPLALGDGDELIRVDDVLEAHELLRDYVGDAHGLFERVSGR